MSAPGPIRAATPQEIDDIVGAFVEASGLTLEEATDVVAAARIVVFEKYVTDSPGYFGNVAVLLHPGGPELVDSVIWTDGRATFTREGA